MIEIVHYMQENGKHPFREWFKTLRDAKAKTRIAIRLRLIEAGNLGDSKPVGEGVIELRIHVGAGYRVYCARHGQNWVVLLCGGDKSSQANDIVKAQAFWADWKRRQSL